MSERPQQRWEYCELRQEITQGVLYRQYILFYRPEEPHEQVTVGSRERAVARLGLEGWELVGTSGSFTMDSGGFRLFFKRPLIERDSHTTD